MGLSNLFTQTSGRVAQASGRPVTFLIGAIAIAAWALSGPLFGFSKTWELVVNTGTTIVTFPMVFLIQNAGSRGRSSPGQTRRTHPTSRSAVGDVGSLEPHLLRWPKVGPPSPGVEDISRDDG